MTVLTQPQAAAALKAAGWPAPLWPTMVAIGQAESGLTVESVSKPNTNGTVDRGWLQINSVHGYDPHRLTTDPVFCAKAGLSIWHSQGLRAWSTYSSGAFHPFLPAAQRAATPAAMAQGASLLGDLGNLAGGANDLLNPGQAIIGGLIDGSGGPLAAIKGAAGAAEALSRGVVTLAAFAGASAAWLGNSHNWTRVVEVVGGGAAVLIALRMLADTGVGGPVGAVARGSSKATHVAAKVAKPALAAAAL